MARPAGSLNGARRAVLERVRARNSPDLLRSLAEIAEDGEADAETRLEACRLLHGATVARVRLDIFERAAAQGRLA